MKVKLEVTVEVSRLAHDGISSPNLQVACEGAKEGIEEALKNAENRILPGMPKLEEAPMAKKNTFPRYKVWVEIEKLLPNGDADPNWELGKPLPDCVGKADTLNEAKAIQFEVAQAFCEDWKLSDCRPATVIAGLKDFCKNAKRNKAKHKKDFDALDRALEKADMPQD